MIPKHWSSLQKHLRILCYGFLFLELNWSADNNHWKRIFKWFIHFEQINLELVAKRGNETHTHTISNQWKNNERLYLLFVLFKYLFMFFWNSFTWLNFLIITTCWRRISVVTSKTSNFIITQILLKIKNIFFQISNFLSTNRNKKKILFP